MNRFTFLVTIFWKINISGAQTFVLSLEWMKVLVYGEIFEKNKIKAWLKNYRLRGPSRAGRCWYFIITFGNESEEKAFTALNDIYPK